MISDNVVFVCKILFKCVDKKYHKYYLSMSSGCPSTPLDSGHAHA